MLGTHFHCNPAFVLHAGKGDTSCTGAWSFRRYIGCVYILVMDIYWTCFGSNSNQKCSCQASLDRANFSLPPRPRSTKQMNLQVCSKCICAGYLFRISAPGSWTKSWASKWKGCSCERLGVVLVWHGKAICRCIADQVGRNQRRRCHPEDSELLSNCKAEGTLWKDSYSRFCHWM